MRRHCIRQLSVVVVKIDTQENNKNELITLPALHRKLSKAEMFDDCKSSLANNALERTFYRISRCLTRTEDKSLWALDCNVADLLHEPKKRLSTIADSIVTPEMLFQLRG